MSLTNIDPLLFDLNDKSLSLLNSAIQSHYDMSLLHHNQTVRTLKKAGRKPLPDKPEKNKPLDPKQKRKAQNRAAQRAFRDRKEKHVSELQDRIAELEGQLATQDEELLKENQELKAMLKRLQDENYALKGSQFTFQFPVKEDHTSSSSGTEDGSAEQTPPSNTTPFTSDLVQFGLTEDPLLDQTFSNELINGKDDLFSYYPATAPLDDFLFPQIDLSGLFDGNGSLFGADMAQQFNLPTTPSYLEKKKLWLEGLKKAKAEGKNLYDYHQQVIRECPEFDIDTLCDDMKRKAQCSLANYQITDNDIEAIANCIDLAESEHKTKIF
ncbi:hypothetical protein BY458DRAFT_535691 [Sporodiniella umbellata]|nr:hypothetical protein BY458DRAFT_535691 [Sporodiniella umbellata]